MTLGNSNISDKDDLFRNVKNKYEKDFGLTWFERYGFNNTYELAIKNDLADEYNIYTYLDLIENADKLVFGGEKEFHERADGLKGLKDKHGIKFEEEKVISKENKYDALDSGEVHVINVNSTDGLLLRHELTLLEDDIDYFPIYEAATIVREDTLVKYPELIVALEKLEYQISDEEMTGLNYLVETKSMDYEVVARDFLESKNLLAGNIQD